MENLHDALYPIHVDGAGVGVHRSAEFVLDLVGQEHLGKLFRNRHVRSVEDVAQVLRPLEPLIHVDGHVLLDELLETDQHPLHQRHDVALQARDVAHGVVDLRDLAFLTRNTPRHLSVVHLEIIDLLQHRLVF